MKICIKCSHPVFGSYFAGVSGPMCEKCLKDLQVFYGLQSLGLIHSAEEGKAHG